MIVRDRIRELRRVRAGELRPNPRNWRTHPKAQQDALRGVLAEVGYADALLARELPDGTLMLVDGHLRAETTPDCDVPVLVLDVTEEEADKILATLDPLAGMAEANDERLKELLASIETESDALKKMLDDVAKDAGLKLVQDIVEDDVPEPPKTPVTKPGDLWLLGEHRLLCGDSTKAEDVGRVMDGERAVLSFTSPPYANQRTYTKEGDLSTEYLSRFIGAAAKHVDVFAVNLGLARHEARWEARPLLGRLHSRGRTGWTWASLVECVES